jgi:hypothetical protein
VLTLNHGVGELRSTNGEKLYIIGAYAAEDRRERRFDTRADIGRGYCFRVRHHPLPIH